MRKRKIPFISKKPYSIGLAETLIILGLAVAGFFLVNGMVIVKRNYKAPTGTVTGTPGLPISQEGSLCCNSGNGNDCHVQTGPGETITYNGTQYGLLKSGVHTAEGNCHLRDTGITTASGDPIIVNDSDGYFRRSGLTYGCAGITDDQVIGEGNRCVRIPNDSIIYVCRENCIPGSIDNCPLEPPEHKRFTSVYGDASTVFDAYFSIPVASSSGIPDVVRNCTQTQPNQPAGEQRIVLKNQVERSNLQLNTFRIVQSTVTNWLSPWCKPAVYLYPQETSLVSVKLNLTEPLTYSDPLYPAGGWNVLADPNGLITYKSKPYDYLYYETQVKDDLYKKPDEGFVVEKKDLKTLFAKILPRLGLNIQESKQFSDYWVSVLPTSKYYFVGLIPQTTLDSLTTLDISPQPQTTIRITLYFETLDQAISVKEPSIITPKRSGFTVVEWGGIFKKHKDENFSCLM